ncbi:MAG: hypothetical protein PHF00_06720 [Elusimicrobia bacterium]|nr:hypothetical protein [Elusimicrobiota bacterium]
MIKGSPRRARLSGQVLAGVIVLLLLVSILVPLMVSFVMNEARWTDKTARNTTALHLAEAGIEKGFLALSLSTNTWYALVEHGTAIADYGFDKIYSDVPGGEYAISITSGPQESQATVISIGRDNRNKEVRAIQAVFANTPMGGVAIYAGNGVKVSGGVNVEWGAVITPQTLDCSGRTFPQFWSASGIVGYDVNPTPPNCDSPNCCQWHAFSASIPPQPTIDLGFYKSSAEATSTYYDTPQTWKNFIAKTGYTYYVDNNLTLQSPGIDVTGNVIVTGNMDTGNGTWGKGNRTMSVPTTAWKQYCRNWAHYKTFDAAAPAAFPGLNSDWTSNPALSASSGKISVEGLLYVGGSFLTGGGGGQADVYGTMLIVGSSTMTNNSGVTVYFNEGASKNVRWSRIILSRVSWQDVLRPWPSGL